MSFANHNILDIALSLIPPTVVQIRKNLGTVVNKFGQTENAYSEWIDVYGIVQPGGEQNEHTNGVDFSKKHVTIWLRGISLDGTHIQWAPDQIRYVGGIFNVVGVKDWFPYDNYKECECVEAMNLAASQRSVAPAQPAAIQTPAKRKPTATKAAQTPATPKSRPPRRPSIFVADTERPSPAAPSQPESGPTLVGKARIKF